MLYYRCTIFTLRCETTYAKRDTILPVLVDDDDPYLLRLNSLGRGTIAGTLLTRSDVICAFSTYYATLLLDTTVPQQ